MSNTHKDAPSQAPETRQPIAPAESERLRAQPARRRLRTTLLLLGPIAIAAAGFHFYMGSGRYISTENAYVKAHKIAVSADIDGRVQTVQVHENDRVDSGQVLYQLDSSSLRIALARAEAELGMVAQDIEAFRTNYRQQLAEHSIAEDVLDFAQRQFRRQQTLKKRQIASEAAFDEKRHTLAKAQRQLLVTQESVSSALVRLGGDAEIATEQHPRYRRALSERDQVLLDIERATIRAPAAGVVNNINLQAGEYLDAGEPAFSLVVGGTPWVTANLKETELTHLQIGQTATLRADSYPDHVWQAQVDSIAPATGAEFSLLPPQNASGNWVKVVQRIPVRLSIIDPGSGPPLRTGMSVSIRIDTGYQRPLPKPLRQTLTWLQTSPALHQALSWVKTTASEQFQRMLAWVKTRGEANANASAEDANAPAK